MDVKDLIERLREAAGALDGTALRVSTSKFDTQIIAELLLDAADALEGKAERPEPMTNGDRIRAMTDEELAESDELLSGLCNVLHGQGYPCEANTCRECLLKWLGSPRKEDT
mgnify:FL=1